jgi:hypothetical protein
MKKVDAAELLARAKEVQRRLYAEDYDEILSYEDLEYLVQALVVDEGTGTPSGAGAPPSDAGRLVADEHATNPPPEVEALRGDGERGTRGWGIWQKERSHSSAGGKTTRLSCGRIRGG